MADPRRAILGIDIGATKLATGVATDDGRLLASRVAPTDHAAGPDVVMRRLVALAAATLADAAVEAVDLRGIGIGCTGPLDPVAGVIHGPPNMPGWDEVPVAAVVERAFFRPVFMANDADAAALGEHRFGAGRGFDHLVYVTISTGIGAGLVVDGRLVRGATGNAGELGHTTVAFQGRRCDCGRRGCLEAYASGTAIAERAREALAATEGPSSLRDLPGGAGRIVAADVVAAAVAGDPVASLVWEETTEALGAGIADAINLFDPQRVILGGGVTRAGEALLGPVRRIALAQVFGRRLQGADIVLAELGEDVGVVGAMAIALEALETAPDVDTRRARLLPSAHRS